VRVSDDPAEASILRLSNPRPLAWGCFIVCLASSLVQRQRRKLEGRYRIRGWLDDRCESRRMTRRQETSQQTGLAG